MAGIAPHNGRMHEIADNLCPALAVHGAGGGGWEWAVWQRVWTAGGLPLLAPDLVPAAAGLAATGLDDYLAALHATARPLSRPLLIGASLGGLLALALAAPLQARALILINPLPPAGIQPRPRARRHDGPVIPWRSSRRLTSTQRSLADADAAAALWAFRRWRDESAAVLDQAIAGLAVEWPRCPVLVLASRGDADASFTASQAVAAACGAAFWPLQSSHVGPLLGRNAALLAARALHWALAESIDTVLLQVPPAAE